MTDVPLQRRRSMERQPSFLTLSVVCCSSDGSRPTSDGSDSRELRRVQSSAIVTVPWRTECYLWLLHESMHGSLRSGKTITVALRPIHASPVFGSTLKNVCSISQKSSVRMC